MPKKLTKELEPDKPLIGEIIPQPLVKEMKSSYLEYAMSVIVSRALPDVRDGLKPVHRRILYAMWTMGLKSGAKFRKSATVVGEVLGKYHPHGDTAVYDTLVRMAQEFNMREMLIRGQGNFGSVDGDRAAAMRYTEVKLQKVSEQLLIDIDKETVDWRDNYDNTHKEPSVLPGLLPNLLLNGTVGIAVGMATNIPPHNLSELCDGIIALIENKKLTVEDLFEHVKGPDFPTGAVIYNKKDILQAYATGKGGIVQRAVAEIEEHKSNSFRIIISEIPYQVNKANLITKIADLVKDKKIDGIRDLRDESDREGIRVVVELKKDAYPKKVLNLLYKHTQMQTSFHVNMLALIDGINPRVLNLKMILNEYIKHRKNVVRRRAEYELKRAKERAHILMGLVKAQAKIGEVIKLIRASKDRDNAKEKLMKRFKLSEIQANAILDMRLSQLAALERKKLEDELKEKKKLIADLEGLLKSDKKIETVVKKEVIGLRDQFGTERRTKIIAKGVKDFSMEDLVPDEDTLVVMTKDGYLKRLPPDTFKQQSRGGKGVIGLTTKEEDMVDSLFITSTHSDVLFFTSRGRVFQLKAYDIPQGSRTAKGQAMVNFLQLGPGEKVTTTLPISDYDDAKFLVMATEKGVIKKVDLQDFTNVRRSGLIAIKLKSEDVLGWVKPSTGKDHVMLTTDGGQAIRFDEKQLRKMGRVAAGVRGLKLKGEDKVVGMDVLDPKQSGTIQLLTVMGNGYGKRTAVDDYRLQGRGGSGILTAKITAKTGRIVASFLVSGRDDRDIIAMSHNGQVIRTPIQKISKISRATQGVRIMKFKKEGDRVATVTMI
ncbi:MAG: DNA gyrase subunit A [Parcubacteria group bacterium]|nr:DNA gyrase subunit A [Parcubacteria group bacterium]